MLMSDDNKPIPKRGGARPGAGRTRTGRKKAVGIYLNDAAFDALSAFAAEKGQTPGKAATEMVERCLRRYGHFQRDTPAPGE